MLELVQIENALWYLALLLKALLLYRLWSQNLTSRYRAFTIYLAVHLVRSLLLMPLRSQRQWYGWAYLFTEPILLVTYVLVVLEIHGHVLESYRGLSVLGRKSVLAACGVSGAVTVMTHLQLFEFSAEPTLWLRGILLLESTVYSTLMLFLLALVMFVVWYPVRLRRNLLHYTFGFCLFFCLMTSGLFLRNLHVNWNRPVSVARQGAYDLCLIGWVLLFRKSWETEESGGPRHYSVEQRQKLLAQLDTMNQAIQGSRKPV
jgi:hypothetical protein